MSFYGSIYRHCFWPAYEALRGHRTPQYLRQLADSQWLAPQQMQDLQIRELGKLLRHAQDNSPWHKARLAASVPNSLADLTRIPVMTKMDIRQHGDEILAQNYRHRSFPHKTGGSTGVPLQFYMSRESFEWRTAVRMRGYSWAGAADAEKAYYLWSVAVGNVTPWQRRKSALFDVLLRRRMFNNFELSKETLPTCLESLNRFGPCVLVGYTSMLEYLARYIRKHGGLRICVHSVITAAEGVNTAQRELLQEVFNTRVFASYGSREFMLIAMQCERGGFHVSADNLIVEVIKNGQPAAANELGQVVITDLHNYATPFIRYEIGDLATPGHGICPCGRGLTLLGQVHGRIPDTIQTPDGKLISGIFFPHLLKEFDWIEQFQVIQKELDRIQVKLVPTDAKLAEESLPAVREQIAAVFGGRVRLEFELVSEIPRNATGKHRAVVSEIPVQI
jgi:phenylacetate-CoA ligase